ncbi:MAG: hypothetical protein GX434_02450 [Peptococcaceae bacterium]|nr:hypothetical protein [Peptococcaceae bacterium]
MPKENQDQNGQRSGRSILDITKKITNLHDAEHAEDAIPGSGRDVIIT